MHAGRRFGFALVTIALIVVGCSSESPQTPSDAHGDAAEPDAAADADCTCAVAPASRCLDTTTLETSRAPGACRNNACEFETFTSVCPNGCADGECQPVACTPSCAAEVCADDGCGSSCGPCPTETTFPGITPVTLGIACNLLLSSDGIHVATIRGAESPCGATVGSLDVWTVPVDGAPRHRTIAARSAMVSVHFTDDGHLVYADNLGDQFLSDLWIAEAGGGDPVQIARNVFANSTVAGDWLYYRGPDPDDPSPTSGTILYVARLPHGVPRVVTRLPEGSEFRVSPSGDAVWVTHTGPDPSLTLFRADGTSVGLAGPPFVSVRRPRWSPDGKHLVYELVDNRASTTALYYQDVSSRGPALLDTNCPCDVRVGDIVSEESGIVFSRDGARVAWMTPGASGAGDVLIHTFAGGEDVRLTGVGLPDAGVSRIAFSVDGSQLYASAMRGPFVQLVAGRTDVSGAPVELGPVWRGDGAWAETLDGAVLAFAGEDETTRVIKRGGGSQSIANTSSSGLQFERTAVDPRLLVRPNTTLAVFRTSGAGPGTVLPGFDSDPRALTQSWSRQGEIPFMFGWAGPVALYPSEVTGTLPFIVVQDLMAWTSTATGRLAANVKRYRVTEASGRRLIAVTEGDALIMVQLP